MRGKLLLLITVLIIFVVIGIVILGQNKEKIVTPLGNTQNTSTVKPINLKTKLKTFEDPAGFLFKYPENLNVEINKSSDQSVFSSLKLTSKTEKGNISIDITGSNLQNLDAWLRQNKIASTGKKIKLADIDAVSYEKETKYVTSAIDVGTLLTISVDYQKNKNYWLDINKTILSSFTFSLPEEAPAAVSESSADEDVIFEGEEVIE